MKVGLLINQLIVLTSVYGASLNGQFFSSREINQLQSHELFHPEKIVNGNNLPIRFDVRLEGGDKDYTALVTKDYEFSFENVPEGSYHLTINTHDFLLACDRFKIEVNENTVLATDYYLATDTTGVTTNVTETPLKIEVIDTQDYYESNQGSLKDLVMQSPLGFIFRNTIFTVMFVFVIVMTAGPYFLQLVAPDVAKRLNEIHREQADMRIEDKGNQPKIEEIPSGQPSEKSARQRKR